MRTKYIWLAAFTAAAGGAAALLLKKKAGPVPAPTSKADSSAPASSKPAMTVKDAREASYSFISGFQDAATVELKFRYDAEAFQFTVVEDSFLVETGDSHVGVLSGDDFSAQFEYATYYSGDDFAKLRQNLAEAHRDCAAVTFGALQGLRFRDGDSLCLVFPIPEDACSYLLVTLVKAADNDDELEDLLAYPALQAMLSSISFERS